MVCEYCGGPYGPDCGYTSMSGGTSACRDRMLARMKAMEERLLALETGAEVAP